MRFVFINFIILFSLASCTNINFLLDESAGSDFLKNNTEIYLSGWDNPVLKEVFFLKLGESSNNRFLLTAETSLEQVKRSVDVNQVAKKIDYKIIISYGLNDIENKCYGIFNTQTSSFSFTPKSSGYNFASDVLFENLLREAVLKNLNSFIDFANSLLQSQNCLDEN